MDIEFFDQQAVSETVEAAKTHQTAIEFDPLPPVDLDPVKEVKQAKGLLKLDLEQLRTMAKRGRVCECCGGLVKVYRRKLNAAMAATLVAMYLADQEGGATSPMYLTVSEIVPRELLRSGGDFARLRHWSLIASSEVKEKGKKTAGRWRITEHGRRFVAGDNDAASHVFIHGASHEVLGFEDRRVTIQEALGKRFSYPELMRGEGW